MKILHIDSNHPLLINQLKELGFHNDEDYTSTKAEIEKINFNLANIIEFSINYYKELKKKYSKGRERKTEIIGFLRR